MTIKFYNYTAEQERVDKTSYLGTATTLTADQVEGLQNVLAPSFIVSSNTVPDYNYAYVQEFGRYYFVDAPIWIANNTWRVNMRIDVLFTYKTAISAQQGIVRYSASGTTEISDPRIAVESVVSTTTTSSIITDDSYYVLRYWDIIGHAGASKKTPNIAFFPAKAFDMFFTKYNTLSEQARTIVGHSIIDVTIVHYLKKTAIQALTSGKEISFMNAGSNVGVIVEFNTTAGTVPADEVCYFLPSPDDVDDLSYMDYDTGATWTDSYFWTGMAKWTFLLPFAGTVTVTPTETGYHTITYCALRVQYEPYENAYVITPYINEGIELAGSVSIPVQTTFAFPIDSSFDNIAGNRIATVLSAAGTVAAGVGMIATENYVGGAMAIAGAITTSINTMERLNVQQAMATTGYAGSTGGVPAYTGTPDPTKIYWINRHAVPRSGYSDLWTAYGKPDGAFRTLSTLTGYVQMAYVILTGMSTVSSTERNEIKSLLLSGVIM